MDEEIAALEYFPIYGIIQTILVLSLGYQW